MLAVEEAGAGMTLLPIVVEAGVRWAEGARRIAGPGGAAIGDTPRDNAGEGGKVGDWRGPMFDPIMTGTNMFRVVIIPDNPVCRDNISCLTPK